METLEDWLKECKATYNRESPKLSKKHSGEFIVINGKRVVEIHSDLDYLFKKYEEADAQPVKIYSIRDPNKPLEKNKDPLILGIGKHFS